MMNGAGYLARPSSFDLFMQASDALTMRPQKGQGKMHQLHGNHFSDFGSNNPCSETYDPSSVSAVDGQAPYSYNPTMNYAAQHQAQHQLLMSLAGSHFPGGGPSNVTVAAFNHLSFSPAILTADSFKHQQSAAGIGSSSSALARSGANSYESGPYSLTGPRSSATLSAQVEPDLDPLYFMPACVLSSAFDHITPSAVVSSSSTQRLLPNEDEEEWLEDIRVECTSLSLDALSGVEVIRRVRSCMNDILTRYIPCVDFLVECQQNLRKGLSVATQKRRVYGKRYLQDAMSSREFMTTYIDPLPQQFLMKTEHLMDSKALEEAIKELNKLVADAGKSQSQGCEAVKNTFLGGMKDGESWGLRRWLSRNGNALHVCTELECIIGACKQLDRKLDSTVNLSRLLRPLAKTTLDRLKSDIPSSYQEVSAAHPYLPFFHRLEAVLRSIANFDPEEDDVICIDDSDDEVEVEIYKEPVPTKSESVERKRKRESDDHIKYSSKRQASASSADDESSSGESGVESVIEIIDVKPAPQIENNGWSCANCNVDCLESSTTCPECGKGREYKDHHQPPNSVEESDGSANKEPDGSAKMNALMSEDTWPVPLNVKATFATADAMAQNLEFLADALERNTDNVTLPFQFPFGTFWDGERYASALRVFASVLRCPDSPHFVERVDDDVLIKSGNKPYSHVIKNPLCFRDIVASLIHNEEDNSSPVPMTNSGKLNIRGLSSWNMWRGMDLLQAIDLVLLNSLAYGKAVGEGKSTHRSKTNKVRKLLWNGINSIVSAHVGEDPDRRRQCIPTRRSETSGFVVYKIKER